MLFYQLAVSALLLPVASRLLGEPGVIAWTPRAVASLAYQAVVVAFASYLTWFWLLTRYLAGRLAVFSFLTPLFGVVFGTTILGEPLTGRLRAGRDAGRRRHHARQPAPGKPRPCRQP